MKIFTQIRWNFWLNTVDSKLYDFQSCCNCLNPILGVISHNTKTAVKSQFICLDDLPIQNVVFKTGTNTNIELLMIVHAFCVERNDYSTD